MSREGILDEIEKLVDEAWEVEEKGINTHVDEYQKQYNGHFDRTVNEEHERQAQKYRDNYMRAIERRTRWDSPMPYSHLSGSRPETLTHKCDCRTNIKVVYLQGDHQYRAFDQSTGAMNTKMEVDRFYCPLCRQQINVLGKILEIKVDMTE